ncbi:hypothetical protein ACHAWU_004193 [Discostella pseudostelligera]|uniref:Uncharacterized protein n=1 Tax=Discostella pseudostelligera TaxID=259834 RepID=A0ABD3M369_9STRA
MASTTINTSSTGSGSLQQQRSTMPRTLPTRKSKAVAAATSTMTIGDGDNIGIESRQDSKASDTFDNCDGEGGGSGAGTTLTNKLDGEEGERIPTPNDVTTTEELPVAGAPLEPAFVLKDMDTIDHPQYQRRASSPHHQSSQQRHHMRSPSPPPGHGSVISRRGRSRSPVGLTPHHHRAESNSRAPSAVTVQAGVGGQDELSSAALAAGEAAANNLAASYHHHHSTINVNDTGLQHLPASPQGFGRRSPSPVSRFPSLSSQSFEISPQHSMKADGLIGSFDWNVGPTMQQQPQQPNCNSEERGDGRRSPLPMEVPHHSQQHSGGDRQYHDPGSNGIGSDQYYSSYAPSYPYYQPNENNNIRGNNNYHQHPQPATNPSARGRSPSPFRSGVVDPDRHHRHLHEGNDRRGNRRAQSNDPSAGGGRHLIRRNSQQALFPEHHILSSHSKDRNDNRPDQSAASSSSSAPARGREDQPTRKSTRGGSRGSGRLNNTEAHRSSVFRGSPTERGAGQRKRSVGGSLPQELLLALEEDEDTDDAIGPTINSANRDSTNRSAAAGDGPNAARSTASPTNTLVASPSMPAVVDPMQVDDCLLQESLNLNDYEDILAGSLSFRKSYDLGQVFSFMKEGGSGGAHGQLSFNLGFSSESNEEDNDKANRLNNDGRGGQPLYGSQSMGLTPINSFSCDNNRQGSNPGIIPLNSIDGMALREFFSSSPNTTPPQLEGSSLPIGSPQMNGGYEPAQRENAPVVHASTPPSYSHHGPDMRYGPPQVGGHGMISHCTYSNMETPPHGPSLSYHNSGSVQSSMLLSSHNRGRGIISMSFPSKRIKLSTKHTVHPIAMDLSRRLGGDDFVLLRKLAPCFANFRYKILELETSDVGGTTSSAVVTAGASGLHQAQLIIAKRRISSSICAFGGSLPSRMVSPSPSSESDGPSNIHGARHSTNRNESTFKEETPQEREERISYEQSLEGRYVVKNCISWEVELHEVIAPQVVGDGRRGQKKSGVSGKSMTIEKRQIGVFKKGNSPQMSSKYCAPVTPSSPGDNLDGGIPTTPGGLSLGGDDPNSPNLLSPQEKGTKIKYRCKLCGQPKQNHTCSYQSAMVRSIGTMVYPAVNAFVSNEPGRLAPALSEMNNFTSLLSQDASTVVGSHLGNMHSFGVAGSYRHPPHPTQSGGLYAGNLITPDAGHWSPNTPGGLSTMSSIDQNSPGGSTLGTPGGPASNMMSARQHVGGMRRRDHNQSLMSRSLNYSMSMTPSVPPPPPVPHTPSMPPAPAGAIPSDVLFRDTMELKREQFRTVGATSVTVSSDGSSSGNSNDIINSTNAFRYPPIPTPFSQRKELSDALFAMSREVPSLADSCAAILRVARENDDWDQAVAELTTQVLVVIKCEEQDYSLEGLRRHLLMLGIAC